MAIINDTSHMISRVVHANRDAVVHNPEFVSHLVFTNVLYTAQKFGAWSGHPMVMAIDSKPYWRHGYYAEHKDQFEEYRDNPKFERYKGQRVRDDAIPWDEIYRVYESVMLTLADSSDFFVVAAPGAEADDVIAVASKYYADKGQDVVIISSDKDFRQLHNPPRMQVWDPIKKIYIPSLNVEHWKRVHALMGDKGDNIQAVRPRVGEKTAEKMALELDYLLKTDPDLRARYDFNRVLTDFDKIPTNITGSIIAKLEEQSFNYNAMRLLKCFQEFRLPKVAESIHRFKLPTDRPRQTEEAAVYKQAAKVQEMHSNTIESFFS